MLLGVPMVLMAMEADSGHLLAFTGSSLFVESGLHFLQNPWSVAYHQFDIAVSFSQFMQGWEDYCEGNWPRRAVRCLSNLASISSRTLGV